MSEKTVFRGEWWLPGARDRAVIGNLTFDGVDGLTLDAIGLFRNPFESQGTTEVFPIVHGRTTDSKDITMCRGIQSRSSWGTGVSTSTLTASVAFVGAHIDSLEDVRFFRAYASLVHLPPWAGISGIQQVLVPSASGEAIERLAHEFLFPPEHPSQIEDWELRFVTSLHTELDYYARAVIEQTASVQVEFERPRSFEELVNGTLRHIEDFLTLAVGRVSSLLDLKVVRVGEDPKREAIRVLFAQGRRVPGADKPVEPEKMVFTFDHVRDQWPNPLRRFVAAQDQIRSAMDLYFAVISSPEQYVEVQFLNLARALESFHRGTRDVTLLPTEQYATLRLQIEQLLRAQELALPRDVRIALCRRLEYWNEISLRKRLRELVGGLRPAAQELIGNVSQFVNRVVDARNYLTHRDPRLRESVSNVPRLIHLTRILRVVIEQHVLQTVGLPHEVLDRHATRTSKDIADSIIVA